MCHNKSVVSLGKDYGLADFPLIKGGNFSPLALHVKRTLTLSFNAFTPLGASPGRMNNLLLTAWKNTPVSSQLKMSGRWYPLMMPGRIFCFQSPGRMNNLLLTAWKNTPVSSQLKMSGRWYPLMMPGRIFCFQSLHTFWSTSALSP